MVDKQSVYDETESAVLSEVESRNYGTSAEDIEAYAGVAGGTAGAALCSAYGFAAAAPACYAVGEYLGELGGEYVVKTWNAIFADDAEYKAYQKRQAYKASKAVHEVGLKSIETIYWNQWQDSTYKMMVLHHELFPAKKYTYVDAVNELLRVSQKIDKPLETASDTYYLPFFNIPIKLAPPIKGPPQFGLLPLPFWTFFFNSLQLEAFYDAEEQLFNVIMKDAQAQLQNLQDTYSASIALMIADYEATAALSPEAQKIINEN